MKVTLGCDPEIFIKNTKTGKVVTGEGLVPGTKKKPYKVKKGAVQLDGLALEFNIEPANTEQEWVTNITTVLGECKTFLPKDHEFAFLPSVKFEKKYFEMLSKESKELGCDPDYNARTGERNNVPNDPGCMRTASGHVHVGFAKVQDPFDPSHFWDCSMLVKRFDKYFENFFPLWDKDYERQRMYGSPGSFRPKTYGVEYRVPSCAWVKYPELWSWMYQSFQFVVDHASEGKKIDSDYYYNDLYFNKATHRPIDEIAYANRVAEYKFGAGAPKFPENFKRV